MTIVSDREAENRLPASKQRSRHRECWSVLPLQAGVCLSPLVGSHVSLSLPCLHHLNSCPTSFFSDNRCAPKTDTQIDVNCMLNKRKQACVRLREAYLRIKCIPREGISWIWFSFSATFLQMVYFSAMFLTINNTKLIMAREMRSSSVNYKNSHSD